MKVLSRILLLIAFFACVLPLHAQTGCIDSPENPTVVLAVVGGIGALIARLRAR
jgi:XrtJ-associated TM-motif-TM protein